MQIVVRARTAFHFSIHSFVKHNHQRNVYSAAKEFSLIYSRLYFLYYCNIYVTKYRYKINPEIPRQMGEQKTIVLVFFFFFFCHHNNKKR